ncbi:hypothetical protein TRIATDRAFT_256245 [Trichoderma atroviride IMI 206040]|uniref:Uncharacterized protein n=1 Tax=Hypocrea atroviridis (strain ATCC 20476 / IMI 206040) TaxID=452589 RepID=G9NQ17_HYPAI|nr:uncharacterized protein TRIATDRAFT_256245 [Trichoderma atroviride IMI 206040]EHK47169.1 hypothetical protein TRIATDRAFT_256245 [Trichoderma atroviride IMI 206040]
MDVVYVPRHAAGSQEAVEVVCEIQVEKPAVQPLILTGQCLEDPQELLQSCSSCYRMLEFDTGWLTVA